MNYESMKNKYQTNAKAAGALSQGTSRKINQKNKCNNKNNKKDLSTTPSLNSAVLQLSKCLNTPPKNRCGASFCTPPPIAPKSRRVTWDDIHIVERKIARDMKNERLGKIIYQAEALFEVGLDAQTKEFFVDTANKVVEELGKIQVTHSIGMPSFTWRSMLEWLLAIPKSMMSFLYGLMRTAFANCDLPIVSNFFGLFESFCEPEVLFEAEAFADFDEFVTPGIVVEGWYKYVEEYITYSSFQRLLSVINSVKKTMSNTKSVFDFVVSMLRVVIQFLNDSFGLNLPLPGIDTAIASLAGEAESLQAEFRKGDMSPYSFAVRCFNLQLKMEEALFSKNSFLDEVSKEKLRYLLRRFTPIVKYCEANINPRNGPRIEPLAIIIGGGTGVGKSTMTMPILLDLLVQILPQQQAEQFVKSHNDFIFYRANENDFWDGYKAHNVAIVYDDFGQRRDSAGAPNPDAFEMIRLKNTAPYHLHFSDIADKQKHYANPSVIYATTNRRRLHFESVENSRAVVRRFDIAMVQYPKNEFCIEPVPQDVFERRLDINKVREKFPYLQGDPDSYISLSVLEYVAWDYNAGAPVPGARALTYEELVQMCVDKYTSTNSRGDDLLAFHEHVKQRAFERKYHPEMDDSEELAPSDEESITSSQLADNVNSWLDEVRSACGSAFDKAKKTLCMCNAEQCSCLKYLTYFGVGLVASYKIASYGKHMYKWFFGANHPQSESAMSRNPNGRVPRVRQHKEKIKTLRAVKHALHRFSGEGCVHGDLHTVIEHNTYMVSVRGKVLGQTVFFSTKHFMWPRHFSDKIFSLIEIEEDGNWEEVVSFIDKHTNRVCFALDFNKDIDFCDPDGDLDLHLLYVTKDKIRLHRDIRKHFLSSEERLQMDAFYDASMELHTPSHWYMSSFKLTIGDPVTYMFGDQEYVSRDLLYQTDSSPGDCGSPIFITDPRVRGSRIAGFHVAGATQGVFRKKPCAGLSIIREELDRFVELTTKNHERILLEDEVPEYKPESSPIKDFRVIAKVKQPHMPHKTKLVATEMHGKLWDITTAPAVLSAVERDGVMVDPRDLARDKYAHNEVYIDYNVLQPSYLFISNMVLKRIAQQPHFPKVYNFHDAVCGIDGLDFVDSINRSTSPGYPHVLHTGGKKGKTYWFGDGQEFNLSSPEALELKKQVFSIIEKAREGYRAFHVFTDCLKDERRSLEKIEKLSTRQFMSCPLDLLIAMRMYFGDFVRHCMQNRIFNGMGLGMDPHDEWGTLVAYLQAKGDRKYTAGDYSKFDAKIPASIGYKVLQIVESFYTRASADDRWVRKVLFQEIINSRHLSKGFVYEYNGGNPSGQPLTSVYNSIANLLILCYSASMEYRAHTGARFFEEGWTSILSRTRFAVFGDDNIVSYAPVDTPWWGQQTLEAAIPKFTGMDYTNERKSDEILSGREITEITYLKRAFRFDGVRWRAPLDLDVIKETLNWSTVRCTIDEMRLRVDGTLMELAQHGQEVFDEHAPRIVSATMEAYDYFPKNAEFKDAVDSLISFTL